LAGHDEMARDRPWDAAVSGSHAPCIGARESCASATARCVEGRRAAASVDREGPNLLGLPIEAVDKLAAFAARGAAGDGGAVASAGIVVIGARHLLGILSKYVDYYNDTRTDLSLAKDAPEPRSVQRPSPSRVLAIPRVGGLHHEYLRRTA